MKFVIFFVCFFLSTASLQASSGNKKFTKQFGIGIGALSPYPLVNSSSYPLMGVIESTYRQKNFGLAGLVTFTNSTTPVTYWGNNPFGNGQTLFEPRVYLSILHFGFDIGLSFAYNSSYQLLSYFVYGPMAGIELPLGFFSIGVDVRYLWVQATSNPTPLSATAMFRFAF